MSPKSQPPKTPVKQKFTKSLCCQRHNVDVDSDIEDACDVSPTLGTKKGRAPMGSGCQILDMTNNYMSPFNSKLSSEKETMNPRLSSNDLGSVQSSEVFPNLHGLHVPSFYHEQVTYGDENTRKSACILEVDFGSPNVSPMKRSDPAARFVILSAEEEK